MRTEMKWALVALGIVLFAVIYVVSIYVGGNEPKVVVPFENRNSPTTPNQPTGGHTPAKNNPADLQRGLGRERITPASPGGNTGATPLQPAASPKTTPADSHATGPALPPLAQRGTEPARTSNPGSPPASTPFSPFSITSVPPEVSGPRISAPPNPPGTTPGSRVETPTARDDSNTARQAGVQPAPGPLTPPVARTDAPPAVDSMSRLVNSSGSAASNTTYSVKESDTLSDIARETYGDEKYWKAILEANPGLEPNRLFVGKKLILPPKEAVLAGKARPATPAPAAATTTGKASTVAGERLSAGRPAGSAGPARSARATYRVGSGDTLIRIAREVLKNEDRWREIWELNKDRLKSADILPVGFELKLPEGAGSTTQPAGKS